MSRIAYVNGRYQPLARATVHVEDRGLQFADSVYEVILVWRGRLIDARAHLDRLERSPPGDPACPADAAPGANLENSRDAGGR